MDEPFDNIPEVRHSLRKNIENISDATMYFSRLSARTLMMYFWVCLIVGN